MSQSESLHGLNCPRCGGIVPIPEGQEIVKCPYYDLNSVVKGERGVRRYQVPVRVPREQAEAAYRSFLKGKIGISGSVAREAKLTEMFQVFLPFWAGWGRALAWAFGQKQVGDSDHRRYEPREVKVVRDMNWNAAACEVGEFGVNQIELEGRPLEPFNPDQLHNTGMVFEPTGSAAEALQQAKVEFENRARTEANLDRLNQIFVQIIRPRLGMVYYPLWVMRYTYRNRAFQVVVDGFSGEVLYGKAPGSVAFRAAVLVGGMAAGSFLAVKVPELIINNSEEGSIEGMLIVLAIGLGLMYISYRKYRYGEHYEYQRYKGSGIPGGMMVTVRQLTGGGRNSGGIEMAMDILKSLEKFK
ncbi:MAG: hypothetical protein HGA86_05845 [Anaerolineaceae bacterium]|nr:hypothetical protein [Anaerolineaceae bacterium]